MSTEAGDVQCLLKRVTSSLSLGDSRAQGLERLVWHSFHCAKYLRMDAQMT
jgi:hypothetical protein